MMKSTVSTAVKVRSLWKGCITCCSHECIVVVHDVILAGGVDPAPTFAARRASFEALDALEGDPQFMDRLCDCRAKAEQRRAAKRAARAQFGKAETKASPVETDEEDDDS
jgi:endoribonuclease Dicer